jgi:hypothetical protein
MSNESTYIFVQSGVVKMDSPKPDRACGTRPPDAPVTDRPLADSDVTMTTPVPWDPLANSLAMTTTTLIPD